MLLGLLKASLSEKAYRTVMADRSNFMADGHECGLLLAKIISQEGAVEMAMSAETIRTRLAESKSRFQALHYNVPEFNHWIKDMVGQLNQQGQTSTDLMAHILTAFLDSNDPEFVAYIRTQQDYIRDHPEESYDYKKLLNRAKTKWDDMHKNDGHDYTKSSTKEDEILTLQAELKEHRKTIGKLQKKFKKDAKNSERGRSSGKSGGGKKDKRIPFPEKLRKAGPPKDSTKPEVIDGIEYWYCTEHKKWGKHPTHKCEKKAQSGGGKSDDGKHNGRVVRALAAIQG